MQPEFIYAAIIRKPAAFYTYIPDINTEIFLGQDSYIGYEDIIREGVLCDHGQERLKSVSSIMAVKMSTLRHLKMQGLGIDNFIDIVRVVLK